jgi:hypothetical protein
VSTSSADLIRLADDTLSGRAQIRSILHEGYEVPDEIIDWIFERFDEKDGVRANLAAQIYSWEHLL